MLEGIINRKLLEEACQKRNISITEDDLQQEIAQQAAVNVKPKADGSPDVAAWMAVVTKQRRVSADIYRSNVVWPTVALKKLVRDKIEVNEDDLKKGYEANYGPRVRCLAIVLNDERRAQRVFDMAPRIIPPSISAPWRPSTRSNPAAKRCAAKCRRSNATAGSPCWKRKPLH